MKLYHYSNIKLSKLQIKYFGIHHYTNNDKKACSINRLFFYTNTNNIEYRFKQNNYLHICNVNKNKLYNINTNKNNYNLNNLNKALRLIKKSYRGIIYNAGGLNIVNLFNDIEPIKVHQLN